MTNPTFLCLAVLAIGLNGSDSAVTSTLYGTDFSSFPVGEDQLVGVDDWVGTHLNQGLHGIDEDLVPSQGKTAYLGYNIPQSGTSLVSLARMNAEPVEGTVRFQSVIGITESIEGGNDVFNVGFLNDQNDYLAAIRFDTSFEDFGVWVDDGERLTYTGEDFLTDFIHVLTVEVDLEANVWSADLDGIPLFEEIAFTAIQEPRNIGGFALEWEIVDPSLPGDNWLLVDDIFLESISELPLVPPESLKIAGSADGIDLSWSASAGVRYQIEYSDDGETWLQDLEGSTFPAQESSELYHFADTIVSGRSCRLYRILSLDPLQ